MSSLTYLITGANRGLGKGFVAALISRPNTTVIAAVRDVAKCTPILEQLPKAYGSKLVIVKIDSSVESDAKDAVKELQSKHGISAIDVVIANAGIGHSGSTVADLPASVVREHIEVNTIGPILLFQAFKPLLQASKSGNPKFIALSTALGSLTLQETFAALPIQFTPYSISKTALNLVVKKINIDEPWLTAYVTHPGLVKTDLATFLDDPNIDAEQLGAIEVDESIRGILTTMDKATKKDIGGTFQNYDGTVLPW
jgi:norsolorinic acid ketoreductase